MLLLFRWQLWSPPQEASFGHPVWIFTSRCAVRAYTGFPKRSIFLEGAISKCPPPPTKNFFLGGGTLSTPRLDSVL